MTRIPYIAIGNDELEGRPRVKAGDSFICPKCGGAHVLEDSDPPMLLFYKCGGETYLGGIGGRFTVNAKVTKGHI